MGKRIASVTYGDSRKQASVWWVEDWGAYGAYSAKESEEDAGAGPYDSAEKAAASLSDALGGKVPAARLGEFVARCRKHDDGFA